jgi:hypothetical protein
MTGLTITVDCALGAATAVAQVKRIVAEKNAQWPVDRQVMLLPPSLPAGGSDLDVHAPAPLTDSRTLGSYGLANGASLELLVQDIAWRAQDCELHGFIAAGGAALDLSGRKLDAGAAAAVAWAISNEVRAPIAHGKLHCHSRALI